MSYKPRVGDKVRLLVTKDAYGDRLDRSVPYVVDAVYYWLNRVIVRRADGRKIGDVFDWSLPFTDLELWTDNVSPAPPSVSNEVQRVITLWRKRNHLAVADRSECWYDIIAWMQEMDAAINEVERVYG